MTAKSILITAPSLDSRHNVSGISSVTNFIISNNPGQLYEHFELGRRDDEKRNLLWFLGIIKTFFKWIRRASSGKIGLVHFNFALNKASVLRDAPLILFAKLTGKKMLIHIHGGEYLAGKLPPAWMKFILKAVFSGNIPVIVLSDFEKETITHRYHVKNVLVLPNCVDLTDAKAFTRINTGVIKLLFIGRISTSKGLAYIYSALTALKSRQVSFKFYMAGAGPEEKDYVEKFSVLLQDDFVFKGVVSGITKSALFKECNIFLLPSLFEGLPMSLLEAMSFGLVPIVTPVGSMKYVVNNWENGILLQEDPTQELADAIEVISKQTNQLAALGTKAADFIFKNYDPSAYIDKLCTAYNAA